MRTVTGAGGRRGSLVLTAAVLSALHFVPCAGQLPTWQDTTFDTAIDRYQMTNKETWLFRVMKSLRTSSAATGHRPAACAAPRHSLTFEALRVPVRMPADRD